MDRAHAWLVIGPNGVRSVFIERGVPQTGSPLLGQAATSGLTRDAAGVYRRVASARGAYEYVTARPTRTLP